ncbi:MAG: PEGA domain-containing protein [Acidobacteriia bacterium]|nr:PEGA domain-containing protein [Terriglobia bacterium]
MNRRVLVVVSGVFGAFVVLAAGILYLLTPSRPAPAPTAAAKPAAPAPPPVSDLLSGPLPTMASPEPRAPKRPAPKPSAAPAPEPASPEPSPDAGVLHIDADVPGAQVFLDRVFLGTAPVIAPNVAPGSHQLNVSAQGWEGISDPITVTSGPHDILVKLKEVRLDAHIDVVHKHRIGSCKGRLVATPQGLRYETADKGDAFSAGLLDLDAFEVDYLQKNLKVQLKKGKKYDFTDPDGNADRLFVFHRDVDKARARLKKGDPPAAPK